MKKYLTIIPLLLTLLMAVPVKAGNVYTDIPDINVQMGASTTYPLSMDGAGTSDFTFVSNLATSIPFYPKVMFATGASMIETQGSLVHEIDGVLSNSTISSSSTFRPIGTEGNIAHPNGLGQFPLNVDTYLGVVFKIGTDDHYGWIRVYYDQVTLVIKDLAYEDVPNTPINAGDMGANGPMLVSSISVQGAGGVTTVGLGSDLQMEATILPSNATDNSVTWSVNNGTGNATINASTGVLTGVSNGNVTVIATANDGSGISGSTVINVFGINIPVSSITIQGQGGATTVNVGSDLQMEETILPTNATNQSVTWSVSNGMGDATIDGSTGVLTGVYSGDVTVIATANDGSGVVGSTTIDVITPTVLVSSITVQGQGGATSVEIGTDLQMEATVLPANATDNSVTWSVTNGSGIATIDAATGILTGISVGDVTATATANDGSGVVGSVTIDVINSNVPVTSITVQGQGGATTVEVGADLQMEAIVLPTNATNSTVVWSVTNGSGNATIGNMDGVLTGVSVGDVTVIATAGDGSGVIGEAIINVVNSSVNVPEIDLFAVQVYPNPTNQYLNISLPQKTNLIVYNIIGEVIWSNSPIQNAQIDVSKWAKGVYLIKASKDDVVATQKIIIE